MEVFQQFTSINHYDELCTKYDISEIVTPNYVKNKEEFIENKIHNHQSILLVIKEPHNVGIWLNYDIGMRFYWIESYIQENMHKNYYNMKILEIEELDGCYNTIYNLKSWNYIKLLYFWDWITLIGNNGINEIKEDDNDKNKYKYDLCFLDDLYWRNE